MSLIQTPVKTLFDAYQLFALEVKRTQAPAQAYSQLAKLKTALLRYTLPGWHRPTTLEATAPPLAADGMGLMQQMTLQDFAQALQLQEQVYARLGTQVSGASKRTYRCALKQMLAWCEQQAWWPQAVQSHPEQQAPLMMPNHCKPNYRCALQLHHLPPSLQQELEAVCHFTFHEGTA